MDIGFLTRYPTWDLRRVNPDKPALSLEGIKTWTYSDIETRSNSYANGLLALGVQHGDRAAILMHNSLDYWALYLGVVKIGAIAVRLNFRLLSEELRYVISDSEPKILCVDDEEDLLGQIEPIRDRLPVEHYFCLTSGRSTVPDWVEPWSLLTSSDVGAPAVTRPADDDAAMLMYTSGTTGQPKGAVWTHGNTTWFAAMQAIQWKFGPETVSMVTGPLYHVGAVEDIGAATLATGGHVVLMHSGAFDIRVALHTIEHHKVTDVLLFPFMIYAMIELPDIDDFDFSSVRRIFSGGDPVLPYAIDWMLSRYQVEFCQVYGLTEGTPIVASTTGAETVRHPASVGKPLPFSEITIRDDDGTVLRRGERGEIWTRSPVVCREYWRKPEQSAETFVDGWCRTGDNGLVNEDGLLVISGRKKDMIRSGGENIYAAELEDVLIRHPAIADIAVIAVPDKRLGETVCAVVVSAGGARLAEQDVVAYAREHLAGYKKPRFVVFIDDLPRTPSGKVMKYVLRDAYRALPESTSPLTR